MTTLGDPRVVSILTSRRFLLALLVIVSLLSSWLSSADAAGGIRPRHHSGSGREFSSSSSSSDHVLLRHLQRQQQQQHQQQRKRASRRLSLETPRSRAASHPLYHALSVRGGKGKAAAGKAATTKVAPPKATTTTTTTEGGGATIPNEVFNLVKGIVGVGVLSLPAGVAAFGNAPSAVLPALGMILVIGVLSAFGFALIGRVCAYTGTTSYRDAWSASVGPSTSWIPAGSATLKTFFACLAYSMVLADTFSSLAGTVRTPTLLVVTGVILLPLCLLKNLKSLAPFSLMGVLGMAYTTLAMTIRFFDGSYRVASVTGADGVSTTTLGPLASQVSSELQPQFGSNGMGAVWSSKSLILLCMLSTAYMAHFNAPKFYLELQNNTIARYHQVVGWSFGISMLLMGSVTAIGYLTFGGRCSGLVLNNYSTNDVWMSGSRIAVAISLVFSYPLAFVGCRDGVLDLLRVPPKHRTDVNLNAVTIALLAVLTLLAMVLKDVSLVLTLAGATLGNALTYVYPALMYRATVKQQNRSGDEGVQVAVAVASAVLGIVMGVIGTQMALQK